MINKNWNIQSKSSMSHNWNNSITIDVIETPLHDGHIPETLINHHTDQQQQQQQQVLRIYPKYHMERSSEVHIIDNSVPEWLVNYIYDYTINYCCYDGINNGHKKKPAWGSYVTLQQMNDLMTKLDGKNDNESSLLGQSTSINDLPSNSNNSSCHDNNDNHQFIGDNDQEQLALYAATYFIRNAMMKKNNEQLQSTDEDSLLPNDKVTKQKHIFRYYDETDKNMTTPFDSCCNLQQNNSCHNTHNTLWSINDMDINNQSNNVHGIAIWALASDIDHSVSYHIDYAELIRYEYGYIIPPILAGTLHCTPYNIIGGDYCVSFHGIQNYLKCGYKGLLLMKEEEEKKKKKKKEEMTDHNHVGETKMNDPLYQRNNSNDVVDSEDIIMKDDNSWIRIPYQYNRMICQSGHLPHLSTKVKSITMKDDDNSQHNNKHGNSHLINDDNTKTSKVINDNGTTKTTSTSAASKTSSTTSTTERQKINHDQQKPIRRVIVGFNVFLNDIGPLIQQAPEHSDEFRERVSQLRRKKKNDPSITNKKNISIEMIQSNPRLASIFIKAKRNKMKYDFQLLQNELDCNIQNYIIEQQQQQLSPSSSSLEKITLNSNVDDNKQQCTDNDDDYDNDEINDLIHKIETEIIHRFSRNDGIWPNPNDVHVHFHHRIKDQLILQMKEKNKKNL